VDIRVGGKWISVTAMAELHSTTIFHTDDGSVGALVLLTREGKTWALLCDGQEAGDMPTGVYDVTEGKARQAKRDHLGV
jgi:hypothetical protein